MRPFVTIDVLTEPRPVDVFLNAFRTATHIIAPVIRDIKLLNIIIGISPFDIHLKSGKLNFELNPDTIGCTFNGLIFLDCKKISSFQQHPIQVACILEEFIHALMNVSDEALVSRIVVSLYGQVVLDNKGRYSVLAQIA